NDGTVRIWDLSTRRQIGDALQGHDGRTRAAAIGVMEGRPVAVTGRYEGAVRVWDVATGEQLGPELVFPAGVTALAVAPGGRLVVGFGHEVAVLSPR
ncbi:hypothetical protein ACFVWU_44715, partial [Kitasatospora sp. NPDC058190]